MQATVYRTHCLMLEAAELVFGYVNELPPSALTAEGEYCIPEEQVKEMLLRACAGLDREDEALRFYFQGVQLEGLERLSCIASCLLYVGIDVSCRGVDDMVRSLEEHWKMQGEAFHVLGLGKYTLNFDSCGDNEFFSLAREVGKLPVPQAYQMKLVEVFSDYVKHLHKLADILRPVAETLDPMLEPWAQRAQPLAQQWETILGELTAEQLFENWGQISPKPFGRMELGLRYLSPCESAGVLLGPDNDSRYYAGVAVPPGLRNVKKDMGLKEREYSALRLLGSPARVEILRALRREAMTAQNVATQLHMHPGSVFRDLNNLYNARLLLVEAENGKLRYRTDECAVKSVLSHLEEYIGGGKQ